MSKRWLDTENEKESNNRSSDFWNSLSNNITSGGFWADEIKKYRDEPLKRLNLALDNLPLPAAFREACVAIRALIREKRKENNNFDEELSLLYRLAAIYSFAVEYSSRLKEPGFNILESIPGNRIKSLKYSYLELGYNKLELLNKTDCKWLQEKWGNPKNHTTLNDLHNDVWTEFEDKLIARRRKDREQFLSDISVYGNSVTKINYSQNKTLTKTNKGNCSIFILIPILLILIFYLIVL